MTQSREALAREVLAECLGDLGFGMTPLSKRHHGAVVRDQALEGAAGVADGWAKDGVENVARASAEISTAIRLIKTDGEGDA